MTAGCRPAVFVDRDGVLVEDVGHLHRPDQLRLLPGVTEALTKLRAAGFLVIVVTNQSAVARGLCSEEDLARIHHRLQGMLGAAGTGYDDVFYCPHHPTEGKAGYRVECACRKPAPGMLLAARERHGIDLGASFLVGDQISDVEAAHRAGCRAILLLAGRAPPEISIPNLLPECMCDALLDAALWILGAPLLGSRSPPSRVP